MIGDRIAPARPGVERLRRGTRRDTVEVFRGAAPYAVAMVLVAIAFILFPDIVTWLPASM
ncbi:hypothetical protein NN3_05740 [Nocardia neocaledoniensis NBRC 108232]|uniref:ABC transporter permease n=1 Tax=Nocardia neocaledoniensis TaxID=236511 RepID=A0A317N3R0_9NOCA|nr:hypothetical protein [Nocardia neocaledoniensis]PWV68927.1 hypothetical protein DFR69_11651 [Nocardia neocaledoniensis]GEM29567.1 hypothetical protein NN3_05740 [Nocardia neocaledoniensis NBRC 108232]